MERNCENCKSGIVDCQMCVNKSNYEPMTHGDEIRAMSDEELAEFLQHISSYGYEGADSCKYCGLNDCSDCQSKNELLVWLQQTRKAEEDA